MLSFSSDCKRGEGGWGHVLVIEHKLPNNSGFVTTIYGHLDANDIKVEEGKSVEIGQLLGTVGKYPCYGDHLHFGIRRGAFDDSVGEYPIWLHGYLAQSKFRENYCDPATYIIDGVCTDRPESGTVEIKRIGRNIVALPDSIQTSARVDGEVPETKNSAFFHRVLVAENPHSASATDRPEYHEAVASCDTPNCTLIPGQPDVTYFACLNENESGSDTTPCTCDRTWCSLKVDVVDGSLRRVVFQYDECASGFVKSGIECIPASTTFAIGNRVESTADLNVRSNAGLNSSILGVQALGAQGTVIGGPVFADGRWWWQMDFDTGADGWVAEDFLEIPPPEPTASSWPMFQHDAQHTGHQPDASISLPLAQRWTFTAGGHIPASPTIANGTVYVGSTDGKVHALDAITGSAKWPAPFDVGVPTWFSSALVYNEKIYIRDSGTPGNLVRLGPLLDTLLYAIDAATGTELWRVRLGQPENHAESSPIVFNGIVYVGSWGFWDSCPLEGAGVYAINAETGVLLPGWPVPVFDPFDHSRCGQNILSSPAATENTVVVGSTGYRSGGSALSAFDRVSGAPKWSVGLGHSFPVPSMSNGMVYIRTGGGGRGGDIIAFDEHTGVEVWRKNAESLRYGGSPAIANGTVYTASEFKVMAFDANTGTPKWTSRTIPEACTLLTTYQPSFAIANEFLFIKSDRQLCGITKVYALSTLDGSLLWDSGDLRVPATPDAGDSSTPSVANGWLYFATGNVLYAYGP